MRRSLRVAILAVASLSGCGGADDTSAAFRSLSLTCSLPCQAFDDVRTVHVLDSVSLRNDTDQTVEHVVVGRARAEFPNGIAAGNIVWAWVDTLSSGRMGRASDHDFQHVVGTNDRGVIHVVAQRRAAVPPRSSVVVSLGVASNYFWPPVHYRDVSIEAVR